MKTLTIRGMTIGDYHAVLDLLRATIGIGLRNADSFDGISRYLSRNPGLSFVAEAEDGSIVGCVFCGHDGRRGSLNHLAVDDRFRRQGVGRSLASRATNALKAEGIFKVHIDVYADNIQGQKFWVALGFETRTDIERMSLIMGRDKNA